MNGTNEANNSIKIKPFKIGIDCRMWDETGIGRYLRNIVFQIAKKDTTNQYVLFLLPKNMESPEILSLPVNFAKIPVNIRWHTFAEQIKLPIIYLQQNLDLLFVPHFNVPILYPRRFVATVHDLTILAIRTGRATTLPYPIYLIKRWAFKLNVLSTVLRAKAIFTVSNYVREDLIKAFNLHKKDISVTPCAVSADFHPVSTEESLPILQKHSIAKPYLFYVGNAHPHKNLESLLKAFEIVTTKRPDLNLVLGGKKEFFYERLQSEIKGTSIEEKVIFTGFVADEDLSVLYSQAEAFVNPSLYEGFGIQILESFACGTKVICSNTTSLPEVGGNEAFYFDPREVEDMARVIFESLDLPYDREKGFMQMQKFSWEESAQIILDKLYFVLDQNTIKEAQNKDF